MDNDASYNGRVEQNPAEAGEVDGLVMLFQAVNKPQACRKKIGHPGDERNAASITSYPNSEYLRYRHHHGDDGKNPQNSFKASDRWRIRRLGNGSTIRRNHRHGIDPFDGKSTRRATPSDSGCRCGCAQSCLSQCGAVPRRRTNPACRALLTR